jgi:hypothetical protein
MNVEIYLGSPFQYYPGLNSLKEVIEILKKAQFSKNSESISDDEILSKMTEWFTKQYPKYSLTSLGYTVKSAHDIRGYINNKNNTYIKKPKSNIHTIFDYNKHTENNKHTGNISGNSVNYQMIPQRGGDKDINLMNKIRLSDCVHDFNTAICNESTKVCNTDNLNDHVKEESVLEEIKKYKANYIEIEIKNKDSNEEKKIFDVFDNNFSDKIIYVIDFDYGQAIDLLQKYNKVNGGAKQLYIDKGVEVNYDSAGKISDVDITNNGLNIYRNSTNEMNSGVYYPPMLVDYDCINKNDWSPFQQFYTNRKIFLLSGTDNKSMCLMEKKSEEKKENWILTDKVFGQKGDKNEYNFSKLKDNFLNLIKKNEFNNIKKDDLLEGVKFTEEHLIAKRLGDASQALRALYLENSILVTHDRILLAFALFIGVKHIILCKPSGDLTFYYDKMYSLSKDKVIEKLNLSIAEIKDDFKDVEEFNKKLKEKEKQLIKRIDNIKSKFIFPDFDKKNIDKKNIDEKNKEYTDFINEINSQFINILLYNTLNDNLTIYKSYLTTYNSAVEEEKKAVEEEEKKNQIMQIMHLNKTLSLYTKLKSFKINLDLDIKLDQTPIEVKNLKIFKKSSITGRIIRSIIPVSDSEFEKDSKCSIIERIILEYKKLKVYDGNNETKINVFKTYLSENYSNLRHGNLLLERIDNATIKKVQIGGETFLTDQLIKELRLLDEKDDSKDDSIKYKKDEILNCIHDIQYEFILLDNLEKNFIEKVFYNDEKSFIEMMKQANVYYNKDEEEKIILIKNKIDNFFLEYVPFYDNKNNIMTLIDKNNILKNKEYEKYYFILNDLIDNICDSGNINKLNDLYIKSKEDRDTIEKIHRCTDIEKYKHNIHNYFNNIRIINNIKPLIFKDDIGMQIQNNIIHKMIPYEKKNGGTNKQLARRKLVSRKLLSRRKLVSRKLVSRRKRLPLNKEKKIKITRKKKINKN